MDTIKIGYKNTNTTLTVTNTGKKTADYLLTLEGPGWVEITPNAVSLDPGKTETFTINTNPDMGVEEKEYDVKIKATSAIGNSYTKDIKLNLKKPSPVVVFFGKVYTLIKSNVYYILGGFVLLAVVIVFIAISKKVKLKKAEKKIVEKKLVAKKEEKVAKKEEKVAKKEKKIVEEAEPKKRFLTVPYLLAFIAFLVIIAAVLYYTVEPLQEFVNKLFDKLFPLMKEKPPAKPEKPLIDTGKIKLALGFILGYKYYLLAGIVILIAFILLIKRERAKPTAKPEIEIKKVEKKVIGKKVVEKPVVEKIDLGWIYGFIVLAVIAVIAYLVYTKKGSVLNIAFLLKNFFFAYWIYIVAGLVLLVIIIGITRRREKIEEAEKEKPTFGWLRAIIGLIVFILILAAIVFVAYLAIKYVLVPYWVYIVLALVYLFILSTSLWVLSAIRKKTDIEKTWTEATSQADLSLTTEDKRFGFGELLLRPRIKLNNVKLSIKKLSKKPTLLRASDKVYEYFELEKNIENRDIKKAILRFKVNKAWLDKKELEKEDITLKSYTNKWQNVTTAIIDSDDNYVYYESELQRLSYFAIASKRPKEEAVEGKEPSLRWLVVLLIVLVITGGIYFYDYFTPQVTPVLTEREPVISKGFTEQVWDEDTTFKIDLNKHFSDPDGDKLKFTNTNPENVEAEIKDTIAMLTPKPNWYGTDYIVFTADDGKGGIVSSGRVTLIVRDVPEEALLTKIKNWFVDVYVDVYIVFASALGGYLQYIVYGVIGLIILILVIRYNKSIIDFFLEEEEKKKR